MEMYPIGTLARKSGVSVKTIRYYSNMGLLPPAGITETGYRLYSGRELVRLQQISILRFLGASLKQIGEVLANEQTLSGLLAAQVEAVDAEIERLHRLRNIITQTQEDLHHREQPWLYLRNLMEVTKMTLEERAQWWGEWWRKRLVNQKLPEEFVDSFVKDVHSSINSEPTEAEKSFMLTVQQGEDATIMDKAKEHMAQIAQSNNMSTEEWITSIGGIIDSLHTLTNADPDDPLVQSTVEKYVRLSGPVTANHA